MEGVTGMMARLSHMQRVAVGGSAMYRTRVFFSFRVRATVATSPHTGGAIQNTLTISDFSGDRGSAPATGRVVARGQLT